MDELTLHHALLRREAWPGTGGEVEFRETHASRVYLVGERVYKVKKPVDFGFLDFTTMERRIHFCREEVRLNDRFAPGTYLGVGELRADGGRIRLDGAGERVEVAVVMRRLPAERMLDQLLAAGDTGLPAAMGPLGVRLAELHATSTVCHQAPGSDRRQVRSNWEENFAQTAAFVPSLLPRAGQEGASRLVDSFFRDFGTLLEERQAAGYVRDGHGDLHSAHICLTEPLQIFDCIEFNPGFRIADTSADLAFLLMDLEFLGRRDLAATLLAAYRGGGGPDPGPERLITFYKAYRAWVRAKVDGLLARAPTAEEAARARAAALSRRYFSLALGYFAPRQLLLTCGLMGSGKSTLARALAHVLGATLLRSDGVRKELAGTAAAGSDRLPFGAGIYSPAMTAATYERLLALAAAGLGNGSVIVDAAFTDPKRRRSFLAAAAALGYPARILYCRCPAEVARRRLDRRREQGDDLSDGRPALYARQAATFAPPGAQEPCIAIDTTRDVDYNVQLVIGCLLGGRDTG
jgi:uncharacterized protein